MLREGDIVAGKYRIDGLLGAGAMGTVYTAHHILLKEKVAIKFLHPEAIGHSESVSRFVHEARAVVQIQSDHVVRIRDVELEDGRPYIVMDHLEGCDLAAWLRQKGRLPADQAVDFIVQACEAIAKAHEIGIIHRDLKPANMFVVQRADEELTIKVLDFGISKSTGLVPDTLSPHDDLEAVVTEERVVIGSPFYMSPEQMESARDVDERTDIWALGVTLCQLITGKLPFDGTNLMQVFAQATSDRTLRLRESSPFLSPGHEAVILKCLQRDRDKRYRSVRELLLALAGLGSQRAALLARSSRRTEAALAIEPSGPTPGRVGGAGTLPSRVLPQPLVATLRDARPLPKRRILALVAIIAMAGLIARAVTRPSAKAEDHLVRAYVEDVDPLAVPVPGGSPGSGGAPPIATRDEAIAPPARAPSGAPPSSPPGGGGAGLRAGVTAFKTTLLATTAPVAVKAPAAPILPSGPPVTTPAAATATSAPPAVPNPIPTVLGGRK